MLHMDSIIYTSRVPQLFTGMLVPPTFSWKGYRIDPSKRRFPTLVLLILLNRAQLLLLVQSSILLQITADPPEQTVKVDVFCYGIVLVEVVTKEMIEKRSLLLCSCKREWEQIHGLIIRCTKRAPADCPQNERHFGFFKSNSSCVKIFCMSLNIRHKNSPPVLLIHECLGLCIIRIRSICFK